MRAKVCSTRARIAERDDQAGIEVRAVAQHGDAFAVLGEAGAPPDLGISPISRGRSGGGHDQVCVGIDETCTFAGNRRTGCCWCRPHAPVLIVGGAPVGECVLPLHRRFRRRGRWAVAGRSASMLRRPRHCRAEQSWGVTELELVMSVVSRRPLDAGRSRSGRCLEPVTRSSRPWTAGPSPGREPGPLANLNITQSRPVAALARGLRWLPDDQTSAAPFRSPWKFICVAMY